MKLLFPVLLILVPIFGVYTGLISPANSKPIYSMDIQLHANPETQSTFKNANLDLYITNMGNVTDTINSIEFIIPKDWTTVPADIEPTPIAPNRTLTEHIQIKFPSNVVSGKYKLGILVNTTHGDYLNFTEINLEGWM